MPNWTAYYNENRFFVKMKSLSVEFYVNDVLVDCQKGYFSGCNIVYRLSEKETVKVIVTLGLIKGFCYIYVNDRKIFEGKAVVLNR